MDWTEILYLILAGACLVISVLESNLLRKTKGLNGEVEDLLNCLKEMPDVVPCYECRFYLEEEPFCPKSGMRMKDGLIFCCYGERKEDGSDEGNVDDNGCR